jgi:hypothetical protein
MNGKRLIYLAADEGFVSRQRRTACDAGFEPLESSSSPCLVVFLLDLFAILIIFIVSTRR